MKDPFGPVAQVFSTPNTRQGSQKDTNMQRYRYLDLVTRGRGRDRRIELCRCRGRDRGILRKIESQGKER